MCVCVCVGVCVSWCCVCAPMCYEHKQSRFRLCSTVVLANRAVIRGFGNYITKPVCGFVAISVQNSQILPSVFLDISYTIAQGFCFFFFFKWQDNFIYIKHTWVTFSLEFGACPKNCCSVATAS